ncbi:DUF3307 domain-containing protein [Cyclobacterium amurskyense]|jgi:hypothetical protein|uniref:DUF3307 domain-containing protein n=1 Tax=Cyclobacterium amurskyense TaxID=320787 RepID=A0A0H4PKT7_9BACT|nr:DUF3307 domain-containing protein [Cyclobacterium amurskyense]AKP53650.1 hypothetical protein CA2015_4305 [Cyclobacterium amurskyense]|tara:strand:+ start:5784 stop:6488 length:705 start_codon:yes stop_codon:yes gene_type:complete
MIVLIKLVLAHLLGDFVFQPNSWVEAKEAKKFKAYQLYLHLLVHGLLIMVILADLSFWPYAVAIVLVHGIVDVIKLYAQKEQTKRYWFFIDQLAHILTLIVMVGVLDPTLLDLLYPVSEKLWLVVTLLVFLSLPASIIIKTIISKWTPATVDEIGSLEKAGQYIGILERWFVLIFIIAGKWEAIGFLVAAKSVFRFGDLKESKDRKLTEYILIGTLVSFGLAILCGWIYEQYQL